MASGSTSRAWAATAFALALSIRSAAGIDLDLCGGIGVYIYRDLPKPFPDFVGQELLDVPTAEGDDSVPTMELGVPCEYVKSGCERLRNWGKGPVFPDDRMPKSLVTAGVRYFEAHQNALPWFFLGHIVAHCEVTDPAEAQLFYVPYPIVSLYRTWQYRNTTVTEVDAHYALVKEHLRAQALWRRCDGCDHIISIEKPSDTVVKVRVAERGGYYHEDTFWSRVIRLGHHHGVLRSDMNARYADQIETPFDLPVMSVPFTVGFLPKTDAEMDAWLDYVATPAIPREPHAIFLGETRHHRTEMIRLCEDRSTPCSRAHVAGQLYFRTYREYVFSIQPGGDVPARRAFFDSLVSSTIPIVFDPSARIAGRADGFVEDVHQHYRLCYEKFFSETGWGAGWLDKVALVAVDEADAMRLVKETTPERIAELQSNIREVIPRVLFWDHMAPAAVASQSQLYTNVSVVPTALRVMARDVQAALRKA